MTDQTKTMTIQMPTPPTTSKGNGSAKDEKKDAGKETTKVMVKPPSKPTKKEHPAPVHKADINAKYVTLPPKVWAKINYLRDRGSTEVSMMAVSSEDDPLRIVDVRMIKQWGVSTFTEFEDKALANYVEDMVIEEKIPPQRCMRIWIHTHPNMSPTPSGHDEKTFKRVNAESSWGAMIVVANNTEYARLVVNNSEGMHAERELRVHIDMQTPFEGVTEADYEAWEQEYCDNLTYGTLPSGDSNAHSGLEYSPGGFDYDWDRQAWGCGFEEPDEDGLYNLDDFIESEQTIMLMQLEPDGFFYVYSENFWMQFSDNTEVLLEMGDKFESVSNVSQFEPHDWGSVVWYEECTPFLYTRYGDEHDLNELRVDTAAMDAELQEWEGDDLDDHTDPRS